MPEGELILAEHEGRLELRHASDKPGRGLVIDFVSLHPKKAARRGGLSKKQPLGRAMGKGTKRVLDATAGLGHDAALLACMGFEVIAVERSPIVAALLRDGLRRALESDEMRPFLAGRLEIIEGDSRDVMQDSIWGKFDVIYIDPMFPPKRKASALAKKEIRMVRQVVGDDEDAADLLEVARKCCKRVVVKRPTHAGPLACAGGVGGATPIAQIEGKLARYDVYCRV